MTTVTGRRREEEEEEEEEEDTSAHTQPCVRERREETGERREGTGERRQERGQRSSSSSVVFLLHRRGNSLCAVEAPGARDERKRET